jgi:drug/metabolite transporter (DMT)-like permease
MNERRQSLIQLNAAVLLWGGTCMFAKWIDLPAFQISGVRAWIAAAVMVVAMGLRRQKLAAGNRRDSWMMIGIGLALAAHWITYFHAIQISTVAIGILALHTYPVLTAVVEPLVFRESVRVLDLVLALVVLLGVAVLVPEYSLGSQVTRGILWGILSAVFFTIRNLLSRHLVRSHPSSRIMAYQFITVAVVLLPFVLSHGEPMNRASWIQVVILGIGFTALPQTLFTSSMRHLTARTVSVIATLLPIYGAVLAAAFLDEIPAPRTVLGGGIIIAAVFLDTWRAVQAPKANRS